MGNTEASPENPDIHVVPNPDSELDNVLENAVDAGRRIIEGAPSHKDSTPENGQNVRALPVVGRGPDAWKDVMDYEMRKTSEEDQTQKARTMDGTNE